MQFIYFGLAEDTLAKLGLDCWATQLCRTQVPVLWLGHATHDAKRHRSLAEKTQQALLPADTVDIRLQHYHILL